MGKTASEQALKKCISDKHEFDESGYLFTLQMIPYMDYLGFLEKAIQTNDTGSMNARLVKVSVASIKNGTDEAAVIMRDVNGTKRICVAEEEIDKLPIEVQQRLYREVKEVYEVRGSTEKK